ncbi:ROK family protein (putative glucokinase) [Bacteroides ovatus]|uniref:ROK family protein (Putative glucokinase) n=3 Tax=Bacteroides TaxID=816 RepID=A0A1G8F9U2_BACOV|nr:ROK family protein (putative glucokinase) [Bacteroides ovatus]
MYLYCTNSSFINNFFYYLCPKEHKKEDMKQHLLKEIEAGSKNALLKKKIITHYIYNGSSTITDLSKELDLSVPTVTKFISEMCEDGYINDYGKLETSGGRHPSLYGLNPESGYFIGVDIKKFAINIGLINFKGDMVELKMNIPFKCENTPNALEELCKLILQFIKKVDIDSDKILNININVSGRVNPESGYSFSQFNFEERPLAEVLTERIGFPVTIDNDTRGMTYGEYMQGCVKGEKDIIFVNISWGLGIGIIIDGRIYTGKSGFSGEFGHTNVFDNEIICHCGKKGCLETEASGTALHRILIERIQKGESSILSNRILSKENPLTLDEIIASVNKEDPLCIEIVEEIGQKLGKQIAGLINIFNPELVIIGGTLSLTGDYITQPIKTAVRKYSLNLVNKDSAIITSKLKDKAGIVGACMLARSRMFES